MSLHSSGSKIEEIVLFARDLHELLVVAGHLAQLDQRRTGELARIDLGGGAVSKPLPPPQNGPSRISNCTNASAGLGSVSSMILPRKCAIAPLALLSQQGAEVPAIVGVRIFKWRIAAELEEFAQSFAVLGQLHRQAAGFPGREAPEYSSTPTPRATYRCNSCCPQTANHDRKSTQ